MYVLLIECQVFALHANGIISSPFVRKIANPAHKMLLANSFVSGSLDFTHGLMIRYGESWFWPKG